MTVSPGDILKLSADYSFSTGDRAQNVYHFRANLITPVANSEAQDAVHAWMNDVLDTVEGDIANGTLVHTHYLDLIEWVTDKWEVTANIGSFVPAATFAGAGDLLPQPVSPFAVFNTLRPKSKGRKFLFGYTEGATIGSVLQAGQLANLADYADAVMTHAVIDVLNYFVPGIPRFAVDLFLDFTGAIVTNIVGTQRRRRPTVGI